MPNITNFKEENGKRTHLSPLSTTHLQSKFCNLRIRDNKQNVKNGRRRSQSVQSLNELKELNTHFNESLSVGMLCYDDRFIPKHIKDINSVHDKLNGLDKDAENFVNEKAKNLVDDIEEKYLELRSCISENDIHQDRILTFSRPAPKGRECGVEQAHTFIRNAPIKPKWKLSRCVPKLPERVLDAPELVNDFYLNVLHWGSENVVAIGLGQSVYVWYAETGKVDKIRHIHDLEPSDYISSVKWSGYSSSSCLATGYTTGTVKLYDVKSMKCLRKLTSANGRIASLSWNANILSCGSRSGSIVNYDVRMQNAKISSLDMHTQEVCGLEWSCDGKYLASGGNDNNVYVWEKTGVISGGPNLHNFVAHRAAVKALAWHPIETNILVTGGGTNDHNMHFWNVFNGSNLSTCQTNSQISGILWNPRMNELVSSHGQPQNQLTLWSYPSMEVATHLISHTDRILSISLSPDGTTVASVGADETLRIWKCFEAPPKPKRSQANDVETKIPLRIH